MFAAINSSTLKGRDELRSLFRNKSKLSEEHFASLIASMLNKRDDRFHGLWQEGRTYRKGDIVYYDRELWEMTEAGEICGRKEEAPGKANQWSSRVKDLEKKIEALNQELETTKTKLQTLQTEFDRFKQQMTKFISLLILGFGFLLLWLLLGAVSRLIQL